MTIIDSDDAIPFTIYAEDRSVATFTMMLELAGADPVPVEPVDEEADSHHPTAHIGAITGLTFDGAARVAAAYLATVSGENIWLAGTEVHAD